LSELTRIDHAKIETFTDLLKGLFKCFTKGIAEEWICEDKTLYDRIMQKLPYDHLQIGGQGGIVANVLAKVGVQNVIVHTNSLPALQAAQFAPLDNLLSFDENARLKPAYQINRTADVPMIHLIIEFDRGDALILEGKRFRCPKSNRFIATYDPLNLRLVINKPFLDYMQTCAPEYVVLSGFHALTENNDGLNLIADMAKQITLWRQKCPACLLHLEIASTQDRAIRRAIMTDIAPLADSIGINEREAIDLLEVLDEQKLAAQCQLRTTAENLFKALVTLKEKTGVPRIQLHMFGLYMTLQNENFRISPEAALKGMMTAATVAAAKAGTGTIDDPLWAHGRDVSDVGLIEAESLAVAAGQNDLSKTGIGRFRHWNLIVVPTILIEKPITLVGMGDTISSLSLVAAR
jgi:ADP-dependent phosphofructokinase/glucokinase